LGTYTGKSYSSRFEAAAEAVVTSITERRNWALALLALLTTAAILSAARVEFDNAIEVWFADDDVDLVAYEEFYRQFQADEFVLIALASENVFSLETRGVVERVTKAAEQLIFVHRIHSVLSIEGAESETDPALLRDRALDSDLVRGSLVSADGRMTAIVIELHHDGNTIEGKQTTVAALRDIVQRHQSPAVQVVGMTGTPALDDALYSYSDRDLRLLSPVMFVTIAIIVYLVFGSLLATFLPLIIVMTAVIWTVGLMGALGQKMTLMSSALIPLVLAIGVADSIHILVEYRSQLAAGMSNRKAAIRSVTRLLIPCLFTTTTTAVGLLSLSTSDLAPIREFAFVAAAGVVFAFLISVLAIPGALLSFPRMARSLGNSRSRGYLASILRYLATTTRTRSHFIVLASLGVCAVSVWSISRIEVGVNPMSWLPESSQFRIETETIDRSLNGTTSLEFLVHAPDQGFNSPATLRQVEEFQQWLVENTSVLQALSVVDILKDARRIAQPGIKIELPASRQEVTRHLDALETSRDLGGWLTDDRSTGRISARVALSRSSEVLNRLPAIQSKLDETMNRNDLQIEMTGYVRLMATIQRYLLDSQIRSLVLAFCIITALMFVLLGNWRLASFALIPNITPILVGMGAMGVFGVDLTPGTVMIAAIVMGLVVDDTVHFLLGLQRRLNGGAGEERAIEETVTEVGQALAITSVVLATGFGTLVLGSYAPNVHFGAIAATVIVLALIADVVLLPAALRVLSQFNPVHDGAGLGPADIVQPQNPKSGI